MLVILSAVLCELVSVTACAALVAYVGFQAVLRHQAVEAGREYARAQRLDQAADARSTKAAPNKKKR